MDEIDLDDPTPEQQVHLDRLGAAAEDANVHLAVIMAEIHANDPEAFT